MKETEFKNPDWLDVTLLSKTTLDKEIDTTGVNDVSEIIQTLIENAEEDSVLYFPKGNYYFENGITIHKRITIQGVSYYGDVVITSDKKMVPIGRTNFITRGGSNKSIITLSLNTQCIKNINFYADSCEMTTCTVPIGEAGNKRELIVQHENVAAISITSDTKNYSHYEHLYAYGFSGTAFALGTKATARNITVTDCGKGMNIGTDSMLTNSKIQNCANGLEIAKGVALTNIRIEKMQEHGLITIGEGFNQIMNIFIRECGYSAVNFDSFTYSQFTGILENCCQFYDGITYKEFCDFTNKKEEAYALFYGKEMKDAIIDLIGRNSVHSTTEENHKIFVIKAQETQRVLLTSSAEADTFIQSAKGSLLLENPMNTYKFYDGEICSNGYVQMTNVDTHDPFTYSPNGTTFHYNDQDVPLPVLNSGSVIASVNNDVEVIMKQQTGIWERIGEKTVGGVPVHYYKKLED